MIPVIRFAEHIPFVNKPAEAELEDEQMRN